MGKKSRLKKQRRQNVAENQPRLIKGTLKKLFGKGTSDPFTARMMMQIFNIRDFLFKSDTERKSFDQLYEPIIQNLLEAQYVKDKFIQTVENHNKRLEKGKIAKLEKGVIKVDEPIDFDLNIFFKDFFIRGYMALDCIKKLTDKIFDINIEFLFQTDKNLEKGLQKFKAKHPEGVFKYFIDMLIDERRQWFSTFIEMRIAIEHKGFKFPEIRYVPNKKGVIAILPKMGTMNKVDSLNLIWENLFEFCENTVVMMFATKFKKDDGVGIVHIPEHLRDPHMPIKYKVALMPPQEQLKRMDYPNRPN